MDIQIITPDKTLFSGQANLVQFPGLDGSFEVLNNHAPLISALKNGRIKVKSDDDQELFFDIKGGVVEVLKNKMLVLAE
jgi:F-type H+-transporting ATPase subunit epsilon